MLRPPLFALCVAFLACGGRSGLDEGRTIRDGGEDAFEAAFSAIPDVVALYASTCALRADGTVWCWGDRVGDHNPFAHSDTPISMGLHGVHAITDGRTHFCAETEAGLVCFGLDDVAPVPVVVSVATRFDGVALGSRLTCVHAVDGAAWCGSRTYGVVDLDTLLDRVPEWGLGPLFGAEDMVCRYDGDWLRCQTGRTPNPNALCESEPGGKADDVQPSVQLGGVRRVAMSSQSCFTFGCAVLSDETVSCWGHNYCGVLGNGMIDYGERGPSRVAGLRDVLGVTVGRFVACAWLKDGRAFCWGTGGLTASTDPKRQPDPSLKNCDWPYFYPAPVLVEGLPAVRRMSAGEGHICAVDLGGDVWCWGANQYGQLGIGSSDVMGREFPERVEW